MYFIKYKDQEIPLIIDFAVIKTVTAKLNIKFQEFEKSIETGDGIQLICFEALKRGHKISDTPFTITLEQVEDILCIPGNHGDFLTIFAECILNVYLPKDEAKKKILEQLIGLNLQN